MKFKTAKLEIIILKINKVKKWNLNKINLRPEGSR